MYKIYIIEDQLVHQKFIEETINKFIKQANISAKIISVESISTFVKELPVFDITNVDIFFIDINLKRHYTGIDIAEWIRHTNPLCKIIFITNDKDQSMTIITRNIVPFDYIQKNSNLVDMREKIHNTLKKIFFTFQLDPEEILILAVQKEDQLFAFSHINYIQTIKEDRFRVYLQTTSQELLINESFSDIKKIKFPKYFLFLKSYILNLRQINSLNRTSGIVTFKNGSEIYFGNKIMKKLVVALENLL
ncbi:response regulator receiver domain protein [Enterococcus faecalis 13-SD-W-01]|nr:response regulator receiver domain protein [Enterococcus faecalis 13-SD-W-01]